MIARSGRFMSGCLFLVWLAMVAVMPVFQTGCAADDHLERFEFIRVSMGVPARIIVYAKNHEDASGAAAAGYERIAQLDDCMSDYRPRSELMRLCDHAGGPTERVSDDLFRVLVRACEISQASDGAFDVTVGPMVKLWREARKTGVLPDAEAVNSAHELVGWEKIELDPGKHEVPKTRLGVPGYVEVGYPRQTVRLKQPGMRLDLGGIAKGYAAQRAVEVLKARGHARCLVAMSGDIAAGDAPPGKAGWEVEIGMPMVDGVAVEPSKMQRLLLSNAAVSTSGDTQQFVEIGGVRYSHIVDPRTGMGVTNHTMCTVVAVEGSDADGYSSAACVLGAERAAAMFANMPNLAAIVWEDGQAGMAGRIHDPRGLLRFVGGGGGESR